jgi:hypothetical protein
LDEIDARLDGVDVHEDLFVTKPTAQPVIEATRISRAVTAAVADEHASRLILPALSPWAPGVRLVAVTAWIT